MVHSARGEQGESAGAMFTSALCLSAVCVARHICQLCVHVSTVNTSSAAPVVEPGRTSLQQSCLSWAVSCGMTHFPLTQTILLVLLCSEQDACPYQSALPAISKGDKEVSKRFLLYSLSFRNLYTIYRTKSKL